MHKENDLYDLLISGKGIAEGRYNHATWDLLSHGDLVSEDALIASVHESMHHILNNSTLYGLTLIVAAYLAREREQYRPVLKNLVANSRLTHEVYATYSSLLLTKPEIASKELMKARYPDAYLMYITLAKELMHGITEKHLQFASLYAVSRLCFQSKGLVNAIQNEMPFEISTEDYPDTRFRYLTGCLTEEYWTKIIQEYRQKYRQDSLDKLTQLYLQKNGDTLVEETYGTEQLNTTAIAFQDYIYTTVRQQFMDKKNDSIDYDDHLKYLQPLLNYAEQIAPGELSTKPLKMDSDPNRDFGLSEYENESIHLRTNPSKGHVIKLSDVETKDWETLQFNFKELKHIYVVSRITEKLIQQFDFDAEDRQWLTKNYPDYVNAIYSKRKIDNETVFLICILDKPQQIAEISNQGYFILSNSSMLLFADRNWDEWHDALQKHTTNTALFDLSPSTQIERSAKQYDTLEYQKFHLEIHDNFYPFVCIIGRGTLPTGVFFMPVSEIMANILIAFLQKKEYTQPYDETLESNNGINILIQYTMAHLIDETVFDFQSLNTKYALRSFTNGTFEQESQ